jgi:hypothetical protein
MVAPCLGEVIWSGGSEESRLSLTKGPGIIGTTFGMKEDGLNFSVHRRNSSLYKGDGVGQVTGLLREGLAANARDQVAHAGSTAIRFLQDGKIELTFTFQVEAEAKPEAKAKEYKVLLTRAEARELVRLAGAFFAEQIAKHAKAEPNADLD